MDFGAVVLIGIEDLGQTCANGLPLAPSPTRMLSHFWKIFELRHTNLCKYLELVRCHTATNGVIIISEHYNIQLLSELNKRTNLDNNFIWPIIYQLCCAIEYCHNKCVIIGFLTLKNIYLNLLQDKYYVKLAQYGLYHISGCNADVKYLIGSVYYLAPERLLHYKNSNQLGQATFKSDIWSFGIILVEIFAKKKLSEIWGIKQILSILSSIIKKGNKKSALGPLLDAMQFAIPNLKISLPNKIYEIAKTCLEILPSNRFNATEICQFFKNHLIENNYDISCFENENLHNHLNDSINKMKERIKLEKKLKKLDQSLEELYFLWKLCGSSVENILLKKNIITIKSPICTLPRVIVDDMQIFGNEEARTVNNTFDLFVLPNKILKNRLNFSVNVYSIELAKKIESVEDEFKSLKLGASNNLDKQTLVVKERDFDYQIVRMKIFCKLLAAYPYKADLLKAEARKDICPFYRAAVWAAMLDVFEDDAHHEFIQLDTFSEHVSDRQLHVDIPRCHQYDELMTSSATHYKLKVLIKAWLVSSAKNNSGYVYWQGLDSLAAPFLVLHYNNLAVAFQCLSKFIERYLHNFFLQDNSETIQNYLSVFMLLVKFCDPELATHLYALEFSPQLFAIPWFLTCFAHVLPLNKIFHLWDTLLLNDATFPLFIGVSILIQLRSELLKAQFNDAILLFSDLPDLSIDKVVTDSKNFYNFVPSSCNHINHNARHCIENLRLLLTQSAESPHVQTPSQTST